MKLYRVEPRDDFDESQGFTYFSSKREALKFKRECEEDAPHNSTEIVVDEIEFEMNKKGILRLLHRWASHPDNG